MLTLDTRRRWHAVRRGLLFHASRRQKALLPPHEEDSTQAESIAGLEAHLAAMASLSVQHAEARLQAEQMAALSRMWAAEMEALFDAIAEAVVVYDAEGRPVRANPAAVSTFGFDPVSMREEEAFHRLSILHSDGRPVSLEELPYRRALRGKRVVGERYQFPNAEGNILSFLASATPLPGLDGQLNGAVAVWNDITELERAAEVQQRLLEENQRQRKLAEAEHDLLKTIFESAPEGIVVADAEGRVVMTNPAADRIILRPMPYGEPYQTRESILICYPDGRPYDPRDLPLTRAALDGETSTELEVGILRPDGQRRSLLVNTAPIRDAEERLTGAVGVFQDITERKQMEERLEASNRELQDFAFIASHDLQEPLRKIQAFGDRLEKRWGDELGEEGYDFLKRMLHSTRRMQEMIEGLLAYSRVATRARPFMPVDLGEIAAEVLSDLEIRIEHSQARVEVGELPELEADPLQMRQLLQNLIGNALKFQRAGVPPVVKVYARGAGEEAVEIVVEDNGTGFDEQYAGRMFQPFQRLVGRSEYEGSGMGLAICRKIVERHHGSISGRSRHGEGTTFVVRLPTRQGYSDGSIPSMP